MKKSIRKLMASFMAVAAVIFILLPVNAKAARPVISVSNTEVKVGDEFTVTVSGTAASRLSLSFDPSKVTLKSRGNATYSGNTVSLYAQSASFTFTAKETGFSYLIANSSTYGRSSAKVNISEATADTKKTTDTKKTAATVASTATSKTTDKKTTSTKKASSDASKTVKSSDAGSTKNLSDNESFTSSDLSFKELLLDRRMLVVLAVLVVIILILAIRLIRIHVLYDVYDYDTDNDSKGSGDVSKPSRHNDGLSAGGVSKSGNTGDNIADDEMINDIDRNLQKNAGFDYDYNADDKAEKDYDIKLGDSDDIMDKLPDKIDDPDALIDRLMAEDKLKMPKVSKNKKKLHVEDLN
ncbi:MAG: hypothetical protein DUD27_06005 [Lachnospiraceae bacterium]|uniref:Cohesin domain-containing protein n=1 Tax=Candidatus Weimeria bifida TaxID=2599074 RepID=A0A6N7IX17_9FIRM|nr:hypothetical protein [Candidatus Weimeria bifida]RRF96079.1 MAG: hypothetical protein DUD27_06005 [Lachnospiraceae bacterium]